MHVRLSGAIGVSQGLPMQLVSVNCPVIDVIHVALEVFGLEIFGERVCGIDRTVHLPYFNDPSGMQFLQKSHAASHVREPFHGRFILGDHDADFIVTPHWYRRVAENAKGNETKNATDVDELCSGG